MPNRSIGATQNGETWSQCIASQADVKRKITRERLQGSCDWLLEEQQYRDWLSGKGPTCLWIDGHPGTGKTTLCGAIVEDLLGARQSHSVCYYFFDGTLNHSNPLADLLMSLTYQLAGNGQYAVPNCLPLLRPTPPDLKSPLESEAFRCYVKALFAGIIVDKQIILVLDGLDSEDWVGLMILDEIECAIRAGKDIRYVFSSRSTPTTIVSHRQEVSRVCISDRSGHRRDLFQYAFARLHNISPSKAQDQLSPQSLAERICPRSKGTFLWVELVLDLLSRYYLPSHWHQAIDSFPLDLNGIFEWIIEAIPSRDKWITCELVSWLMAAYRVFNFQELCNALSLCANTFAPRAKSCDEPSVETRVRQACSLLVTITPEQTVRLKHPTVREYFNSQRNNLGMEQMTVRGHELIARACIKESLLCEGVKTPCLPTSEFWAATNPKSMENSSWREYATSYWKAHYLLAESCNKALGGLLQHALITRYAHTYDAVAPIITSRCTFVAQHILTFSVVEGLQNLVQIYLSMGVDPTTSSCDCCQSPLTLATATGKTDMVNLMLRFKACALERDTARREPVLRRSDSIGLTDSVFVFLKCGSGINSDLQNIREISQKSLPLRARKKI